jgi:hypothetical protein
MRRPGFAPGSGKWDLWWAKWRWGRFSPSILRFPLPIFIPPNSPSSHSPGAGTIGQKWPTCRVDPVGTPPPHPVCESYDPFFKREVSEKKMPKKCLHTNMRTTKLPVAYNTCINKKKKTIRRVFGPQANYTDRATDACRRS